MLLCVACIDIEPPPRSGRVSGRVLVAPDVGLANAGLHIEQLELYDGVAGPRRQVAMVETDQEGYFENVSIGNAAGLLRFSTVQGTFEEIVSREKIELDDNTGFRALYRFEFFEEREGLFITPVHSLVEAHFRHRVARGEPALEAFGAAYQHIQTHFGDVDWQKVAPAGVSQKLDYPSPTDPMRAAFVLGGLAVLADDVRAASGASTQAVNLLTLLDTATTDLQEGPFDGNDRNDHAPGSGLQVGKCPPTVEPGCGAPPGGCSLGACRPMCDVYANLFRSALVGGIRKYLGSREHPSPWNRTGMGAEDASAMLDRIGDNADAELFGGACAEAADRVAPTITWEAPAEGAAVGGVLTVRVRATDDMTALPRISFAKEKDTDGDPGNAATAVIDTTAMTNGAFTITAIAQDLAGNQRRASRTFQVDNTAPRVTLDRGPFFIDEDTGIWWTGEAAPTLHGAIEDTHPREVQIIIGNEVVAVAALEGSSWHAHLAEGLVTSNGREVTVRAIDQAGNAFAILHTLRLDATPPTVLVERSPVHDEAGSTVSYELDVLETNTWLQKHVVQGTPIDLARSHDGSCATVHKLAHLLYQDLVLGSAGTLNPLQLSAVMSDDGVGIEPGTTQARVTVRHGAGTTEVLPWTAVPGTVIAPKATRHTLSLYRDGALAIPALGTTEGEYHVELRARDRLGRITLQERCWKHRLLAPPLRPELPAGRRAAGFDEALSSTTLASPPAQPPLPAQDDDVATKFLNATATGVAVWAWPVKNYLGVPVYVTVSLSRSVNAHILRQFVVRNGLTAHRSALTVCGPNECNLAAPTDVYRSPREMMLQQNLRFRARLFAMDGAALGAEILPCAGCTNDDETQTYTFQIPARTTPQGSPLASYVVLTHLLPTLPAGTGTDVLMAPRDGDSRDDEPSPYRAFSLNGYSLTGKLLGGLGAEVCTAQEHDGEHGQWICTEKANRQRYRALLSVTYGFLTDLVSSYRLGPTATIRAEPPMEGILRHQDALWTTEENATPLP